MCETQIPARVPPFPIPWPSFPCFHPTLWTTATITTIQTHASIFPSLNLFAFANLRVLQLHTLGYAEWRGFIKGTSKKENGNGVYCVL